ncbi:hypothetical protein OPV22_011157 [Ensete ventricosum]|uniref:Uncharacterized protein n=1 Tax=Ensete ventricosum TaxID=4639 RepID=A0AAV8PWI8_ENSVE|nr:hypothetical protein OPV22_011157 [Ensete ventricosum]
MKTTTAASASASASSVAVITRYLSILMNGFCLVGAADMQQAWTDAEREIPLKKRSTYKYNAEMNHGGSQDDSQPKTAGNDPTAVTTTAAADVNDLWTTAEALPDISTNESQASKVVMNTEDYSFLEETSMTHITLCHHDALENINATENLRFAARKTISTRRNHKPKIIGWGVTRRRSMVRVKMRNKLQPYAEVHENDDLYSKVKRRRAVSLRVRC